MDKRRARRSASIPRSCAGAISCARTNFPTTSPAGSLLDSGNYQGASRSRSQKIGYRRAARRAEKPRGAMAACSGIGDCVRGRDIGLQHGLCQSRAQPRAAIASPCRNREAAATRASSMDPLGSVIVHIDSVPNGQGHSTAVAQIVADEIGVKPQDVAVVSDLDTFARHLVDHVGELCQPLLGGGVLGGCAGGAQGRRQAQAVAARMLGLRPNASSLRRHGVGAGRAQRADPDPPARRAAALGFEQSAARRRWRDLGDWSEFSPASLGVPDEQDRMRSSLTYTFQCDVAAGRGRSQYRPRACSALCRPSRRRQHAQSGGGRGPDPRRLRAWLWRRHDGARHLRRRRHAAVRHVPGLPVPDRARNCRDLEIGHVASPSPNNVHGCKGLGDGCSMIAPVALANAIADAIGTRRLCATVHAGAALGAPAGPQIPDAVETARRMSAIRQMNAARGGFRGEGRSRSMLRRQHRSGPRAHRPESLRAVIPGCEQHRGDRPERIVRACASALQVSAALMTPHIRLFDSITAAESQLSGRGRERARLWRRSRRCVIARRRCRKAHTHLHYRYGGRYRRQARGFGQRMLDGVVRVLLASFFERLGAHLARRSAGAGPRLQMARLRSPCCGWCGANDEARIRSIIFARTASTEALDALSRAWRRSPHSSRAASRSVPC